MQSQNKNKEVLDISDSGMKPRLGGSQSSMIWSIEESVKAYKWKL